MSPLHLLHLLYLLNLLHLLYLLDRPRDDRFLSSYPLLSRLLDNLLGNLRPLCRLHSLILLRQMHNLPT